MHNDLGITRADNKFGYCVFGLDTSPSLCHEKPQERKGNETLRANIEFRATLLNSVNVIIRQQYFCG